MYVTNVFMSCLVYFQCKNTQKRESPSISCTKTKEKYLKAKKNNITIKTKRLNYLLVKSLLCRGSGIRTHDPLLPKQVR